MGDDADCHELPFSIDCLAYAHLVQEGDSVDLPSFYIIIRGAFFLEVVLCLYRLPDNGLGLGIELGEQSTPPLLRLYAANGRVRVRLEPDGPSSCLYQEDPFHLVDQASDVPMPTWVCQLPDRMDPPPQPRASHTLSGSFYFRLMDTPDLLQLSVLPVPPSPFLVHLLGASVHSQILYGLSRLPTVDQMEIRCAGNRSLYILQDHVHHLTAFSNVLLTLGGGQAWLSLESYPALVVMQCLEGLLLGWFRSLSLNWRHLKKLQDLLVQLQLSAELGSRLSGQVERAMVGALAEGAVGAERAADAMAQAELHAFPLLLNRSLVALARARDLPAWLHHPAFPDAHYHPYARRALAFLQSLHRHHTRPRP